MELVRKMTKVNVTYVRSYESGECFGEQALITKNARAATIKCVTDCYFGVLHKNDYD